MNSESMENFICERRKAKNLTQKQLAEQLNITDKAVSKWERGLGYPDITVLTKLAETLGVTTSELLNGSQSESSASKPDVIIQSTLQYAEKVTTNNHRNANDREIYHYYFMYDYYFCLHHLRFGTIREAHLVMVSNRVRCFWMVGYHTAISF